MQNPLVSVILFSYNAKNLLKLLLPSLAAQTYNNFEVLLYDFHSTDGTKEWVENNSPLVKIYYPEGSFEAYGYSKINNLAIKAARGDYILVLNLDVVLESNYLEEMIKAIKDQEQVGWAAGKMLRLSPEGVKLETVDCLGHHLHKDRYAKDRDYSRNFDWKDYAEPSYVFGASGCAALYKRAMLERVAVNQEYFDEDFYAYFEDVDLDWRAQLLGWKCLYVPTAVGYHIRGASGWLNNPKLVACLLSNRFFMMIKNDELSHVFKDFYPFWRRTVIDLLMYLIKSPGGVLRLPFRLIKFIPKMYQKRQAIKARQAVTKEYMRGWFR